MTALVLCLWTTSFTLIANFAPSGATTSFEAMVTYDGGNSFYGTIDEIAAALSDENGNAYKVATVKLLSDVILSKDLTSEYGELTLDLNGYVLRLHNTDGAVYISSRGNDLTIIDSRPNVEHYYTVTNDLFLVDDTLDPQQDDVKTLQGGVITGGFFQVVFVAVSHCTINGGNIVGNIGFPFMLSDSTTTANGATTLEINGGTIQGNALPTEVVDALPDDVANVYRKSGMLYAGENGGCRLIVNGGLIDQTVLLMSGTEEEQLGSVEINGGSVGRVVILSGDEEDNMSLEPATSDVVTLGENVEAVIENGEIVGYKEKVIEPEPTDPTEQEPNDNKTPVLSGTTSNGQPTSDDFMKIMMIGVLVIVALSVVSIAASLLIIKKYRPHVA